MLTRRTIFLKVIPGLLAAFALAAIVAPRIRIDSFRDHVRWSLERSLGRRVDINNVRMSLFPRPGFTMEDVIIHEEPGYGIEPFVHVLQLEARLGLSTLWTRHLEFSHLRLDEPSVNLVHRTESGWNLVPLVKRTAEISKGSLAGLPTIEVRSGRLYLKWDDLKSQFYLNAADMDISPRSGGADGFDIRLDAEPARTDRGANGFAAFHTRGRVTVAGNGDPFLDLTLGLAKAPIEEITRVLQGYDLGVHGALTTNAEIKGPLSDLRIKGRMQAESVHRWDASPQGDNFDVPYRGQVQWWLQKAKLETINPKSSFQSTIELSDWLRQPRWQTSFVLNQLTAASVVHSLRQQGISIPQQVHLTGMLSGTATYFSDRGWEGEMRLADSELKLAEAKPLTVEPTNIAFSGKSFHFGPAQLTGSGGQSARVEWNYEPVSGASALQIEATALNIAELHSESGYLMSAASVPVMEGLSKGRWTGWLHYESPGGDAEGKWSGKFDLNDASVAVPGLAEPVLVQSALVQIEDAATSITRMRGHAGTTEFFGNYRYLNDAPKPHRFDITIPEIDANEWQQLLMPTLTREQGFLARTLRRTNQPPAWLKDRQAEGTLRIGQFNAEPVVMRGLRTHIVWNGTSVSAQINSAKLLEGALGGVLEADLTGTSPHYRFTGKLNDADWKQGNVDLDINAATRGTGLEFLANLNATGNFTARGLDVLPDAPLRTASGQFAFVVSSSGPDLKLTNVEAAGPSENFTGEATTQRDGTLRIDLASAKRTMTYTGSLNPLHLDPATLKP